MWNIKSIIFCAVSLILGIWLSFFHAGIGIVISVSIMGAGIISSLENNKKE